MPAKSLDLEFSSEVNCRVFVGKSVLDSMGEAWDPNWECAMVVGDETVLGLFFNDVRAALSKFTERIDTVGFEPGESSKTRATKEMIENFMFRAGVGRTSCVVALGGGVSLDLAGFVAATYMRGIPWISLPSSLLAQVDASIGGKTGVDTPFGKNLLGAFHQPSAVLCNTSWLQLLPEIQWKNGLAEVVKTAWIADEGLVRDLEKNASRLASVGDMDPELISRCIRIKADVVQEDEREAGPRAWLNFGHTVGHAVEQASEFQVPHGLAVAFGMMVESRIAADLIGMDSSLVQRLEDLLSSLHVPFSVPVDFQSASAYLASDKKNRDSKLRMALPVSIGQMARDASGLYTVEVDVDLVREAWED